MVQIAMTKIGYKDSNDSILIACMTARRRKLNESLFVSLDQSGRFLFLDIHNRQSRNR